MKYLGKTDYYHDPILEKVQFVAGELKYFFYKTT